MGAYQCTFKTHAMNTFGKVAIGAGIVGLLVWATRKGASTLSQWAGQISVNIVKFFPLVVRIKNPSPIYAPVDSVSLKAYFLNKGMYVPFATAPKTSSFKIVPDGSTDVTIYPTIDTNAIKGLVLSTGKNALDVIAGKDALLNVKIELTITIAGISFIEEANTKVYLNDLLKNVA